MCSVSFRACLSVSGVYYAYQLIYSVTVYVMYRRPFRPVYVTLRILAY